MNDKITYSINEAAEALGIGRTKLYSLIKEDSLPVIKIGGRTLIQKSALDEWLKEHTQKEV